jgi:hypothetical protein
MLQLHLQAATVSFGLEVIRHIAMQQCAEPTTSTDGGGRSADPMRDDAFRDQRAAGDRIKNARKVSVAPMMDWTACAKVTGETKAYDTWQSRVALP